MAQLCLICAIKIKHCTSSLEARDVIFTLRNIFEIPKEVLEYYNSDLGSPSNWKLQLCSTCKDAVNKANRIYHQMLESAAHYKSVKWKIIEIVKESTKTDLAGVPDYCPGLVTVASRKFALSHDYHSNSNHFVLDDLAAGELFEPAALDNGRNNTHSLDTSKDSGESHDSGECCIDCHCQEYFRDAEPGPGDTQNTVDRVNITTDTNAQEDLDEDNVSEVEPINNAGSSREIELYESEQSEICELAAETAYNDSRHPEVAPMLDELEDGEISVLVIPHEYVHQQNPENTETAANHIGIAATQIPVETASESSQDINSRDFVREGQNSTQVDTNNTEDTFEFLDALLKIDEKRPPYRRRGWKRNLNCFDDDNKPIKRKRAKSFPLTATKNDPCATHAYEKSTANGTFCRCGNVYAHPGHLSRHIKENNIVVNDEWFLCVHCKKRFKREDDLKYHVRSVHEKIKYVCPTCGKSYAIRGIRRHFRIKPDHNK